MYYLVLPENALGIINPYGNTFTRLRLNIKTTQKGYYFIILEWLYICMGKISFVPPSLLTLDLSKTQRRDFSFPLQRGNGVMSCNWNIVGVHHAAEAVAGWHQRLIMPSESLDFMSRAFPEDKLHLMEQVIPKSVGSFCLGSCCEMVGNVISKN